MRNSVTTWTAILLVVQLTALCLFADDGLDSSICCPDTRQGICGSVDALIWTPRMRGRDFVITDDGSAFNVAGQVREVDLDSDAGLRSSLGYTWNSGWGVDVTYTHFDTDGSTTVNRPPGAGQLFPTFSNPGGSAEAEVAVGTAYLDYDVFDLTARRLVFRSACAEIDLFGGLRWADIGQGVAAQVDGRDFTQADITSTTQVEGFGIRFGGAGRCKLTHGFSAFGNVAIAAIRGDFTNRRIENDFNGTRLLVDIEETYSQASINLETSLGIGWQHKNWFVGAGYEINTWSNISESPRFVDDIEQGGLSSVSGNLLLDGMFFSVAKMW